MLLAQENSSTLREVIDSLSSISFIYTDEDEIIFVMS